MSRRTKKNKQLTKKEFDKLEYPYYKFDNSLTKIKSNLNLLSIYKPIFYTNIKDIRKRNLIKFHNKYLILIDNYNKNKDLYEITDWFSQDCRVKCIYNIPNSKTKNTKSILDHFTENKEFIYNNIEKITHHNIREYLWLNYKQCTNFNTTIILSLLKLFKPTRYLDPSSGWGDRLIGAIAYHKSIGWNKDFTYTGVDPSECMNPKYIEIVNNLVPKTKRDKFNVIQLGYENTNLESNTYDLIFTSPPFFDLEIYSNSNNQSTTKFTTLNKWLNGFLYPSLEKSYKYCSSGGHFCLYISDYKGVSYVNKMKKYITDNIKGFKYVGNIYWMNDIKTKKIRTIYCWKKII